MFSLFILLLILKGDLTAFTVCPRSSDPFYIATYYIEWVTTSWIYSQKKYITNNLIFPTRFLQSFNQFLPKKIYLHKTEHISANQKKLHNYQL